jgi:uncharacterized protein (DUF1684 family)
VSEDYRVTTRLVPDAKKIPILNILGQVEDTPSPGYVEFDLRGQKLRLTPVEESPNELSFIFRDLTAGKETYGSGRFLDAVGQRRRSGAGLQQGLQSAVRFHALRDLPVAAQGRTGWLCGSRPAS